MFQVGSQQRSSAEFREACELVANGYLGECRTCTIGLCHPHNDSSGNGFPRDARRLAGLPDHWKLTPDEWDMWQGPAHLAGWKEDDLLPTEKHLHKSRGTHESDFVDAIFDRSWKTACPCEVGHRSITISHLANSCIRTGVKSIRWDAVRETSDNETVNARADIKRHNGWELG